MTDSPKPPPMALAMEWVSRIMAVVVAMVLPGVLGYWLDGKFGTRFLMPIGFAIGMAWGLVYLIALTRRTDSNRSVRDERSEKAGGDEQ